MSESARREVDRAVEAYYDSLTEEELMDRRLWGEFAAQEFAALDSSEEVQLPEARKPKP